MLSELEPGKAAIAKVQALKVLLNIQQDKRDADPEKKKSEGEVLLDILARRRNGDG